MTISLDRVCQIADDDLSAMTISWPEVQCIAKELRALLESAAERKIEREVALLAAIEAVKGELIQNSKVENSQDFTYNTGVYNAIQAIFALLDAEKC